jgi:hypothetical protein
MTRKGVEEPTHHQGPVNPVLYNTFDVSEETHRVGEGVRINEFPVGVAKSDNKVFAGNLK